MLSINGNEVETNDTTLFELLSDYATLSGYIYQRLVGEFGEVKAKDFMTHKLTTWVSRVENSEE